MMQRIACFVLNGGVGSRLWPLSREDNPKQFHQFSSNGSMLVRTVRRLRARLQGDAPVFLIGSERHSRRVRSELEGMDLAGGAMIFEPASRNTAAAVAISVLQAQLAYGEGLVLVVPSDHEISTDRQFWETVELGIPAANAGRLVVFGIRPDRAETGYGYIEASNRMVGAAREVTRFVEKPGPETAQGYVESGRFFWNAGIFLFRASAMRAAFIEQQPEIWSRAKSAFEAAFHDIAGVHLPLEIYREIPSASVDHAIMEHAPSIAMVTASFSWNDLGSWQSLPSISTRDCDGNVVVGDVVAIDCERSYLHSQGPLLSVIGLKDVAVVATADATLVAPMAHSQSVKRIVEKLEQTGRLETKITPAVGSMLPPGAWRQRVAHWLHKETLPLWSSIGVDDRHGGFHEALSFDGKPLMKPKRMRTMARQVYAFAIARQNGWDGPADQMMRYGIEFMMKGRTERGGWARTLNVDGSVADPSEDTYDHAFVLLALAHAYLAGNRDALQLGTETFAFLDSYLEDESLCGFKENSAGSYPRRSNPHMHLLEAFLAWHAATGDRQYLRRAARIVDLFCTRFFDAESWTLGEYFDNEWRPAIGEPGQWTEPGHHFEWVSLLVDFAEQTSRTDLIGFARKLYASAVANGLSRSTGLAFGAVSRTGTALDRISRSWPQTEAIKATLALDGTDGRDLKPEIETRVGSLFHWHIDAAPPGMWIDRIDEKGGAVATEVPASILYHLISALTRYLARTELGMKEAGPIVHLPTVSLGAPSNSLPGRAWDRPPRKPACPSTHIDGPAADFGRL